MKASLRDSTKRQNETRKRRREVMENSNPQPKRCNSVVTAAELSAMSDDDAPFPTAISQERIDTIVKNAQALMHAEHRVCAVCDEVVLYQPAITDYDVDDLPDSFFSTLCPPDGSVVTCPSLDPMLLEQYNVAMFFPRDAVRMGSLLLSKRAIARQMRLFPLPDAQQPRVPVCNVCMSFEGQAQETSATYDLYCKWSLSWRATGQPQACISN